MPFSGTTFVATAWERRLGRAGWAMFSHTGPMFGSASWLCHVEGGVGKNGFVTFAPQRALLLSSVRDSKHCPKRSLMVEFLVGSVFIF